MRRHNLKAMGFHTGSPFAPEGRMNSQEWQATFGKKRGVANIAALTSARTSSLSPQAAAGGRGDAAPARTTSHVSPARQPGHGLEGRLDPGRLAAARSLYERVGSAPTRSPVARDAATPAASAAASSAPVSRRTSAAVGKRRRRDSSEENERDTDAKDEEEEDTAAASTTSKRTPTKKRKSGVKVEPSDAAAAGCASAAAAASPVAPARAASPPPLETAAGAPAPASAAAAATSSSLSDTFVLSTPLSSLVPQPRTPTAPVDVREKSRHMITDCLQAALKQSQSESTADSTYGTSAGTSSAASSAAAPASSSLLDPTLVSELIEGHLLDACGGVSDSAYRTKLRDLVFNFRGNAPLCMRLLQGEVTAAEVVTMDFKSLAAPDVAAERERLRQANFAATVYRPPERLASSDYKCPACVSTHCSTAVIREERDISKADTWGSKQGAGSVIEIKCEDCQHLWTKEE